MLRMVEIWRMKCWLIKVETRRYGRQDNELITVLRNYCCLPTFAMTGALAWQVNNPNKIYVFCFWRGDGTGLPGSPFRCVVSLFFFPLLCLIASCSRLQVLNPQSKLFCCLSMNKYTYHG